MEDTAQDKTGSSSTTQKILVTAVYCRVTGNMRETIFKDLLQAKSEYTSKGRNEKLKSTTMKMKTLISQQYSSKGSAI